MTAFRSIDDVEAFERVSLDERLGTIRSTYEALRASAESDPDAPALTYRSTADLDGPCVEFSYASLFARVTQAANLFASLGAGETDVVSTLLPNVPAAHFAIWGAEATGIANPVNPFLAPAQIASILNAARTKILVVADEGDETDRLVAALRENVPSLEVVLKTIGDGADPDSFEARMARQPADGLTVERTPDLDAVAAYIHTGGTTGMPKLAIHTHRNQLANAVAIRFAIGSEPRETILVGTPLFHVTGLIMGGIGQLAAGLNVLLVTPGGFRRKDVIQNIWPIVERHHVRYIVCVPTVVASMASVPLNGATAASLRFALSGGAPLPVEVARAFRAASGARVLNGWGMTETTCVAANMPRDAEPIEGSVGIRLPYQDVRVAHVDAERRTFEACAPGETGTIVVKGPDVTRGYVAGGEVANPFLEDGWLDTGDVGRIESTGHVFITGRRKDLIIRGGHNIDPALTEESLAGHPAVLLVAAVGFPDAYAGELPVAYVMLKPDTSAATDALKAYARDHVAERAAAPAAVFVVDTLPLTAVGKIFKPALRLDAAKRAYHAAVSQATEGRATVEIDVEDDRNVGLRAHVRIRAFDSPAHIEEKVRVALQAFNVTFDITTD